eukprot:NODE_242_length_13076_cov_0.518379.p6 type:complete len:235 gc:universal NODE_242_length_13076_cov_0.518379:10670-11374(+)
MQFSLQTTISQLKKYAEHNKPPLAKDVEEIAQSYISQLNKNHARAVLIVENNELRKKQYKDAQLKNKEYLEKEKTLIALYERVQKQEQQLYLEKTKKEDRLRELKSILKEKRKEKQGRTDRIEHLRSQYKKLFGLSMISEENGYYRIIFTKFPNELPKAYFRFRIEDKVLHAVEINPTIPSLPCLTSDENDKIYGKFDGMNLNPLLEQVRSILKQSPERLTEIVKRLHKGWSTL